MSEKGSLWRKIVSVIRLLAAIVAIRRRKRGPVSVLWCGVGEPPRRFRWLAFFLPLEVERFSPGLGHGREYTSEWWDEIPKENP